MTNETSATLLRALGTVAECRNDVEALCKALERVPLWRPAAGLERQCREVRSMLHGLQERFERKLVVTLVGPCGSGKSTLLNALGGGIALSETGTERPTTREVVVLCRQPGDAEPLVEAIGAERVRLRCHPAAERLQHVLLVDTPDVDSHEGSVHIPVVKEAVAMSDLLLCVFNAENPKTRDHADFFAPFVRLFGGEALLAILNKCDRLDRDELHRRILPDFERYLTKAWSVSPARIFYLSARSHIENPNWDPGAEPRHDNDQFEELRRFVHGTVNRAGYVVDRRVEHARRLRDLLGRETVRAVTEAADSLETALQKAEQAERSALQVADTVQGNRAMQGPDLRLYQRLAARWVGPVGWLIAIWTRLQMFVTGMASALRGGGLRMLTGAVRSKKRWEPTVSEREGRRQAALAVRGFRRTVNARWPEVAEALMRGGFQHDVRRTDDLLLADEDLEEHLAEIWHEAIEESVDNAGKRLSRWPLQALLNLPAFALLVHMGWKTAQAYFAGNYLPTHYFVHAVIVLLILLFLCFFFFQILVRMVSGSGGLLRRACEAATARVEELHPLRNHPAVVQAREVLALTAVQPDPVENSEER
ncbi:MAG: 50S ribosome-binding GTPase [Desulfobacteraceae bacterium]|nr:50S ribosome-binding GTPase [Desulfobacteraceae bacterium]